MLEAYVIYHEFLHRERLTFTLLSEKYTIESSQAKFHGHDGHVFEKKKRERVFMGISMNISIIYQVI